MSDPLANPFVPRPSPALQGTHAYAVPRPPIPIDLRLDGNEGVLPSPDLVDALRAAGPAALRNYPDTKPLEAALAARHGVDPAQVIVTAGADEALDRLFRALTWPGRNVVLHWPSFVMIRHYARLSGAELRTVPWEAGAFPVREIQARVDEDTALVFCVSPNNPTGAAATKADVASLFGGPGEALVVLDHAYAEFADEDLTDFALRSPNALVLRTFSKARGLAGLRIGYALGPPEVIALMRAAGGPYSVSSASLVLAEAALRTPGPEEADYVRAVRSERVELESVLGALGASVLPSQANFVLGRFGDATWVRDALAGLGIGVRLFPGEESLAGRLRITCPGNAPDFERLRAAFAAALAPRALLFDLDGVLVDARPGGSRRALPDLQTLASLRGRLPLGVVTGMTRAEATEHLTVAGVEPLVSVLVTQEDAPSKPDPAPVRLALERLGTTTAWMVGDNPGDCRAARAAGVVPLGVLGPAFGDASDARRDEATRLLHESGAARVLTDLGELLPLLDAAGRRAEPFADAGSPHGD